MFCCDSAIRDILSFTHYAMLLHRAPFISGVNSALPPTASMKVRSIQDSGNNCKQVVLTALMFLITEKRSCYRKAVSGLDSIRNYRNWTVS